jgi:hypothetical protein
MPDAHYTLTLGPFIDTIFVFEIGGQYVELDELEGTLNDVFINGEGIRIRVELGGPQGQEWELEVTIDDNGNKLKTVPQLIKGQIGPGGGSWFDRTCPLVQE